MFADKLTQVAFTM